MSQQTDRALAATLQHRIGLARYSNHVLRRMVKAVNEAERDIVDQMRQRFGNGPIDEASWSGRRLVSLLKAMRSINAEAHSVMLKTAGEGLEAQAKYEVEWTQELINRVGIDRTFTWPSAAKLKALVYRSPFSGGILRDQVKKLEARSFEALQKAIKIGLLQGESLDQIVRRVTGDRELMYADGVTSVTRKGAERIIRTATTHVNVATQREIIAANPHLYRGWLFVAVLDERTSLICQGNSGQVFPIDKGPFPPLHYYCRSTILPLLKSQKEDPKIKTYEQWLKEQPEEVQREILGKTRYDLWKQGGLNLKQFVDGGRAFTIDELRKRDAEAFIRAGLTPGAAREQDELKALVAKREAAIATLTSGAQFTPLAQARTTAAQARAMVLSPGIRLGFEHLVFADRRGIASEVVTSDKRNFVAPSVGMWKLLVNAANAMDVHHNHPSGTSLSGPDILMLMYPGARSIYAHGHDGSIYSGRLTRLGKTALPGRITLDDRGQPYLDPDAQRSADRLRDMMRGADAIAYPTAKEIMERLSGSTLAAPLYPSEVLNAFHTHAQNIGFARAGLIRYNARLSPARKALWEKVEPLMQPFIDKFEKQASTWLKAVTR